jgi:hypothetical protein
LGHCQAVIAGKDALSTFKEENKDEKWLPTSSWSFVESLECCEKTCRTLEAEDAAALASGKKLLDAECLAPISILVGSLKKSLILSRVGSSWVGGGVGLRVLSGFGRAFARPKQLRQGDGPPKQGFRPPLLLVLLLWLLLLTLLLVAVVVALAMAHSLCASPLFPYV